MLTFVGAGVALNVAAVLLGAQDGGGNSGATLPLIASLPPMCLAVATGSRSRPIAGSVMTLAAAVILMAGNDAHGYAVLLGFVLGVAGMPYARWRLRRGLLPAETTSVQTR